MSPDSQWILSGSEDGKTYLWDYTLVEQIDTSKLGIAFDGPVTDVAWNKQYHMIATCGFGDEYPILVFVSKAKEEENIKAIYEQIKYNEEDEDKR